MYTGDRLGDRISSPCDRIRRHFLGHNRANDERLLGTSNREGTSASKASLRSGPLLAARIRYVNSFILSKIWYIAQILPAPNIHTQQPTTAITWYRWRVSLPSACINTATIRQMGGWEMPDIEEKCTALLYNVCTCKFNGMEP